MHYLDDLCDYTTPTSLETRKEVRTKGQDWIQKSDFSGSLDDAFQLWDAVSAVDLVAVDCQYSLDTQVYKGVKAAGEEVMDSKMWDEVDQWLSQRR